jgi:hypothetical protein
MRLSQGRKPPNGGMAPVVVSGRQFDSGPVHCKINKQHSSDNHAGVAEWQTHLFQKQASIRLVWVRLPPSALRRRSELAQEAVLKTVGQKWFVGSIPAASA